MPIFTSESPTTVRQRSPWLLPRLVYPVVFLLVALACYGWKQFYSRSPGAAMRPEATAKVRIRRPDFAVEQAWKTVLDRAGQEVRSSSHTETLRSTGETAITISLRDLPAETIVPAVNDLAAEYAKVCRSQWKFGLEASPFHREGETKPGRTPGRRGGNEI